MACLMNLNTCQDKLTDAIKKFLKLIEINKSTVYAFTRKHIELPDVLDVGNFKLKYENSVKFLGLTIDRQLLWKDYIMNVINKIPKRNQILSYVFHNEWGADQGTALLFYRIYVRATLDYGSIFFGSAANSHSSKLDSIVHQCLRTCLGWLKSTPLDALYSEDTDVFKMCVWSS